MMDRRTLLGSLALGVLAAPRATMGQQAKISRVGVLAAPGTPNAAAFRRGLSDLGWVEGHNIAFEYRWAEGSPERLPTLAAELVHTGVDVILAPGTVAVRAALSGTRETPIVFATVADPVGSGFVASLARPGGRITGTTTINRELQEKRLDLLKQALPKLSRLAAIFSPDDASNAAGSRS